MGDYIEASIRFASEAQKEFLIAGLAEHGFEGFEEEEAWLKAYIPESIFDRDRLREFLDLHGLHFSIGLIRETNWNAAWESGFEPVIVDDFCAIRAEFHSPVDGVLFDVVITPKMSFGTGHHATTLLMIEAMRRLELNERKVFDFGTGTGVLAILAEKLGASSVVAVDNDEWSIRNGKENIERNACFRTEIYLSDALPAASFHIILANINKNVIITHMKDMKEHLLPGGVIIVSGMLKTDRDDLLAAATSAGLRVVARQERSDWICFSLKPSDY